MDATAAVLESWRNLYDGKAGLLTRAAVAGHRSVCRKTRRPRLLPVAMVVRAARPRRGREGVHHHEDSTARNSPTSENPNDIRGADVARGISAHAAGMPKSHRAD